MNGMAKANRLFFRARENSNASQFCGLHGVYMCQWHSHLCPCVRESGFRLARYVCAPPDNDSLRQIVQDMKQPVTIPVRNYDITRMVEQNKVGL
jgi:hypothetical protein